jgi:hypothetical protein
MERFMARLRRQWLLAVVTLLLSTSAAAQITGTSTEVTRVAPVDASALGVTRGASLGLSVGDAEYVLGAGFGLADGSLRGFLGGEQGRWSLGAGYARTVTAHRVGRGMQSSVGGELVVGYRYDRYSPHNSAAVGLTIPFALTFGDGNRPSIEGPSIAIYAAPYLEAGMMHPNAISACAPPFTCPSYRDKGMGAVSAMGVGAGSRISFGRFAFELIMRDFVDRNFRWDGGHGAALGLSYRLGR